MRIFVVVLSVLIFICCNSEDKIVTHDFSNVRVENIFNDSIKIRAIAIHYDTLLGFGFDSGYGFIDLKTNKSNLTYFTQKGITKNKSNWIAQQRAVAFTNTSFFCLSIGSPARLRKINLKNRQEEIVYTELHENVFYDAMAFWNYNEGIAIGDPTGTCLSILITRDGGETWDKISCEKLPKTFEGEAAFAASNGNIAIVGDNTWVVSGGVRSRVFYSADKGKTWEVFETPVIQGKQTTGIYAADFYDVSNGIVFGGDYTKPEDNIANKAITKDGGKTWALISDGNGPGYKSCIRYIPNGGGKEMVAVGFTGISISNDFGSSWKKVSEQGFYTLRFVNDSIAIAAGKGLISKIIFK